MTGYEIRQANVDEMGTIRTLFREYQSFLGVDLCFQGFEQELADLPGRYAPPGGSLLLAVGSGVVGGCVGLRPVSGELCEMKRLYVRPDCQGLGLGRRLAEAVVDLGRHKGYRSMVLDTLPKLETAIGLYRSIGFEPIEPYYENPLPGVSYWGLEFDGAGTPT